MTDNKPAYTARISGTDGVTRYYAAFIDGSETRQEIEIPREVYLVLEDCRLIEKRQVNEVERHWERYELTEGQLAARTLRPPMPMEEAVAQAVDMQAALATLTYTQRRRFLLCHDYRLNHEQIAAVEGCSPRAIGKSIAAAKEQLKNFFPLMVQKTALSEE